MGDDYRSHLEMFPGLEATLPFRSLGGDWFHDGEISNLEVDVLNEAIRMHLSAPNFFVDGQGLYLDHDFIITFSGVSYFAIDAVGRKCPPAYSIQFLMAEFNTLGIFDTATLESYRDWYSCDSSPGGCEVILSCISNDEIRIAIAFKGFDIVPKDRALFYLLCKLTGEDFSRFSLDRQDRRDGK